ncbi:hypothetical protein, partial [Intestinimonas timonensis]|uniref:hypothetical protein n=1 Tax=Intestinimonas timonensis TaxID=1689270 RepID=UPI0024B19DAF
QHLQVQQARRDGFDTLGHFALLSFVIFFLLPLDKCALNAYNILVRRRDNETQGLDKTAESQWMVAPPKRH